MAREATPGSVRGGLDALDDPAEQQRLAAVLDGPVTEGVGRGLVRGMTAEAASIVSGTTGAPAAAPTRPTGNSDAAGEAQQASLKIPGVHEAGRGAGGVARQVVGSVMDEALHERHRRGAEQLVGAMTNSATEAAADGLANGVRERVAPAMREAITKDLGPAVGQALAQSIRKDVAPALRAAIRDEIAPALREAAERELGPAVNAAGLRDASGQTSRVVFKEAALGVHDAMKEAGILDAQGRATGGGALGQAGGVLRSGVSLAVVAAAGLGLLVVVLLVWLWVVLSKTRKARNEARVHEAHAHETDAALHVADVLRAAEGRPWAGELRALLRDRLGGDGDGAAVPARQRA